ncbi:MAG: pilus assembly protein N-terminal domain-containing protein, partial [Xanthobacteraceae bacterium]
MFALDAPGNAQERLVALSMGARSSSITITAGKTQDVRVDAPFTDVTVGDPEIADVTPLTDHSLSILGKKIGTTRVSIYGEGKRTVGIFDVEISYDVPRLAAELNRITGGGLRVSSVNGRIMLSGSAPDAVTLDKAVAIARQFAPDVINAVQVLSPQQVVLEVRFVEASREAGRELGVQWNSFGKNTLTNIGSQVPAAQLPVTTPGGPFQQQPLITQGSQVGGANILPNQLPISPIVAAGLLSGTAPFGFLLGALNRGGFSVDVAINALEQKGLIRSLAEPNLVALSGDTASFLAGGEYPIPVPGTLGTVTIDYKTYGVGLSFTPTVLRNGAI